MEEYKEMLKQYQYEINELRNSHLRYKANLEEYNELLKSKLCNCKKEE